MVQKGKLTECPDCGGQVSKSAKQCPHCGHEFKSRQELSGCGGCLSAIIIVVGIGAIASMFSGDPSGGSSGGSSGGQEEQGWQPPDSIDATVICQNFVEDRLVAPSTAEFPWGPNSQKTLKNGPDQYKFRIRSYVDAENRMGANIRKDYTCTVKMEEGADKWQLVELEFH